MADNSNDNLNVSQKAHIYISRVEHNAKIMKSIDDIFQKQLFTDVCLSCENQIINAHRLILAAASSFFHSLFSTQPCCIAPNPVIVIRDIRINELKAILEFIYYGQVAVQENEVDSLIKSAQSLGVYGLGKVDLQKVDEVKRDDEVRSDSDQQNDSNEPVQKTEEEKEQEERIIPQQISSSKSSTSQPNLPLPSISSTAPAMKSGNKNDMPVQNPLKVNNPFKASSGNDFNGSNAVHDDLDEAAKSREKLACIQAKVYAIAREGSLKKFSQTIEPPIDQSKSDQNDSLFSTNDKNADDHLNIKRRRSRGGVSLLKNGSSTSSTSSGCGGVVNATFSKNPYITSMETSDSNPRVRQSRRIYEKKKTDVSNDDQSPVSTGNDQDSIILSNPLPSSTFISRNLSVRPKLHKKKSMRWEKLNQLDVLSKLAKKEKMIQVVSEEELISTDSDESMEDEELNSLLNTQGQQSSEINNNSNKMGDDEASTSDRIPVVKKRRTSCHSIPSTRGPGRPPNSEKQKKLKLLINSYSDLEYDPESSSNTRLRIFKNKPATIDLEDQIESADHSATRIRTSSLSSKDNPISVALPMAGGTSLITSAVTSLSSLITNPTRKKSN